MNLLSLGVLTLMCLEYRQSVRRVMKGSTSWRWLSSVATRRPRFRHIHNSCRPNSTNTWMLVFLLSRGLSPPRLGSSGNNRQLGGLIDWAVFSSDGFFLLKFKMYFLLDFRHILHVFTFLLSHE